jgi:hypothetical protein
LPAKSTRLWGPRWRRRKGDITMGIMAREFLDVEDEYPE